MYSSDRFSWIAFVLAFQGFPIRQIGSTRTVFCQEFDPNLSVPLFHVQHPVMDFEGLTCVLTWEMGDVVGNWSRNLLMRDGLPDQTVRPFTRSNQVEKWRS